MAFLSAVAEIYATLLPLMGPARAIVALLTARPAAAPPAMKIRRTRLLWGAIEQETVVIPQPPPS
jgi:hypothetical protein